MRMAGLRPHRGGLQEEDREGQVPRPAGLRDPLAVVPALCGAVTSDGGAGIALAGLGIGTYLAGIGYACYANFSTSDEVSLLRGMLGQFVYIAGGAAVTAIMNALPPADDGWPLASAAACIAMGAAVLACAFHSSRSRFSALDL